MKEGYKCANIISRFYVEFNKTTSGILWKQTVYKYIIDSLMRKLGTFS